MHKNVGILCVLCFVLIGCTSVSKSLETVVTQSKVTDAALKDATSAASDVSIEANELVVKANKTHDKALIAAVKAHVATTDRVVFSVKAATESHEAENAALTKADTSVADLEKHDTEMTKKAETSFWKLCVSYGIAALSVLLLILGALWCIRSKIFHF